VKKSFSNSSLKNIIKAGVIGFPISHSLSPIIHNFYLNKYKINGTYEAFAIPNENFEDSIKNLVEQQNLSGFNITIPHKEKIYNLCHHLSKTAQITKAVNTVIIMQNGKFFGHNSDAEGFIKNFFNHFPNYRLNHKKCLVIGAGGASRAIVYSLISQKVAKIFITNRDQEKALKLIADFKNFSQQNLVELEFVPLKTKFDFLNEIDLIINGTSLGMINQQKLDIDISNAKKTAIVYDIVYKPLITDLLRQAKELDLKIITGIGMLIEQALIGFEAWFKIKAEFDLELEKILLKNC
jgi:shikimate dehydrogenase